MENKLKDKLISSIMSLDDDSKQRFTRPDLEKLSIERLRHILLFSQTMNIQSNKSTSENDED